MSYNPYRWDAPAFWSVSDHQKDIKPDNILISRNNINIDKFIDGGELAAAQATPKNHTTSPENAILSKPLTVFTPTELADLNQVPKFDVLLTDYGTGKRAAKKQ